MTLHVNVLNEMTLAIALQTSSHAQWLARAPKTFQLMNWLCANIHTLSFVFGNEDDNSGED